VGNELKLFSDTVVLLKGGWQISTPEHIKRDIRQFLATEAAKEVVRGKSTRATRVGPEIIGKSLGRLPFVSKKGHLGLSSEFVRRGAVIALSRAAKSLSFFAVSLVECSS
jgi:hypothetical protein